MVTSAPHRASDARPWVTARLWVAMAWALGGALALAAWDAGERWAATVADRPIVLVPERDPDALERASMRERWLAEPGVAAVEWLAPDRVLSRLRAARPEAAWNALLPDNDAWLPWMAEVRLARPLDRPDAAREFLLRRAGEGPWQLVLADTSAWADLAARRRAWRWAWALAGAVWALTGAAALARLPESPARLRERAAAAAGAGASAAGIWAVATLAGGIDDRRSLALAFGAALTLASFVAPMIRDRRQPASEPTRSSVALVLGEASHERPNPRPRL